MWVKKMTHISSFYPRMVILPSFPRTWARRKVCFCFCCNALASIWGGCFEKQTLVALPSLWENEGSHAGECRGCSSCGSVTPLLLPGLASAKSQPSSSLFRPREHLLVLSWNAREVLVVVAVGRWISFSLESLVHCCLLERLGFQRQGSLTKRQI